MPKQPTQAAKHLAEALKAQGLIRRNSDGMHSLATAIPAQALDEAGLRVAVENLEELEKNHEDENS